MSTPTPNPQLQLMASASRQTQPQPEPSAAPIIGGIAPPTDEPRGTCPHCGKRASLWRDGPVWHYSCAVAIADRALRVPDDGAPLYYQILLQRIAELLPNPGETDEDLVAGVAELLQAIQQATAMLNETADALMQATQQVDESTEALSAFGYQHSGFKLSTKISMLGHKLQRREQALIGAENDLAAARADLQTARVALAGERSQLAALDRQLEAIDDALERSSVPRDGTTIAERVELLAHQHHGLQHRLLATQAAMRAALSVSEP